MDAPHDQAGAISRFREGPAQLEGIVTGLPDDVLDAVPSGGGWTIRQIVHHIVDGDDIWKLSIKMALGDEQAEFGLAWYRVMSQQAWGDRWAYGSRSIDASLALLKAIRVHILQLLENLPGAWHRAVVVRDRDGRPERIPIGFVIEMQADHLFHHAQRIREIVASRGGV